MLKRPSLSPIKDSGGGRLKKPARTGGSESMEYFMMPTEKISSLQQFKKTEKDVIGGLCRFVLKKNCDFYFGPRVAAVCLCTCVCDADRLHLAC